MKENRRSFLRKATVASIGIASLGLANAANAEPQKDEKKVASARKSGDPICVGLIGAGSRSREHVSNVIALGGQITAFCDIQQLSIDRTNKLIADRGGKKANVYTGSPRAFEEMLAKETFDAVIIASPWEWHVPMSIAAMKAGVPYVGVEVSAANTLEECWDLVNISEQTGSQLMILENVCYRQDVMAVLNMVRTGLFGEIIHCRCGYEHDLRDVKFNDGKNYTYQEGGEILFGKEAFAEAQWRTQHSIYRNGDLYPTHGAGPVAEYLNINRGNRFLNLSAMATQSRGLHKFIIDKGGANHPYKDIVFNCGDIVTSMIKCANGQTVIVTHDTNSARPYSLGFRVQGTDGLWYNDGNTIYVEGQSKPHAWDKAKDWVDKYNHALWRDLSEKAKEAGHGGMDYMMMYDFFQTIKNNAPVPLDAYDAAAWSAISALSEASIAQGGSVVDFPDFTRGQWIKRRPIFAIDDKFPSVQKFY
ncbi:MAG: Gfo/Idh/MocA family oxidoreductase [Prevotellaceae bacterium]|jgi:predicted dehydrogenase|nr:Gfo/Idh/MocA family oxidoreductase [Prevotellaceae bacterium]